MSQWLFLLYQLVWYQIFVFDFWRRRSFFRPLGNKPFFQYFRVFFMTRETYSWSQGSGGSRPKGGPKWGPGFFEMLKQNWFANIACPAGFSSFCVFSLFYFIFFCQNKEGQGPFPRSATARWHARRTDTKMKALKKSILIVDRSRPL